MYNTMFKNLKEVSETNVILKASFDHMFYDDTMTRVFILDLEDCEEDITIKQYLNNWAVKHNYYLIEDSIEIFDNSLNKLNI
jgi:hypothetical protein